MVVCAERPACNAMPAGHASRGDAGRRSIAGRSGAALDRRPLKLIYYEACLSKIKEIEREKMLKTGFGRSYLKRR